MYLLAKTLHLVFVISWMAAVFYLPRILVNLAEASAEPDAVGRRLALMGQRLYRFGHVVFALALLTGLGLWGHFKVGGGWLHAKLALVALILVHFVVSGRWLRRSASGAALPSARALRWFNEIPVLFLLGVVWLALAKPF
ncbi:MAG: membrane protein [Lysobacteraceae bacterium]|nr:MAG: membrane protein [Xanthomonadaceae bacterium]